MWLASLTLWQGALEAVSLPGRTEVSLSPNSGTPHCWLHQGLAWHPTETTHYWMNMGIITLDLSLEIYPVALNQPS